VTFRAVYSVYKVYINQKEVMATVTAKSSQKGLKDGWTRGTFILRKDYLEKLKTLAYWERKKIKEVIDEALGAYLKGKKIKPMKK
jgi:uncharacterized protein YnzC (UPF0291/DUF896 family)